MTCPAVLIVTAGSGFFKATYPVGCISEEGHRGAHKPNLAALPIAFASATKGTWAVKVRV